MGRELYKTEAYKKLTPEQKKEGKKFIWGMVKFGIGAAIFIYALTLIIK